MNTAATSATTLSLHSTAAAPLPEGGGPLSPLLTDRPLLLLDAVGADGPEAVTLGRPLGEGGEGAVFAATGARGRRLAVKLYRVGEDAAAERELRAHAAALRAAGGRGVNAFVATARVGARAALVSRRADGDCFWLVWRGRAGRRRHWLSPAAQRDVAGQLLSTVGRLHAARFFLGDGVKPENWLVTADASRPSGFALCVTDLGNSSYPARERERRAGEDDVVTHSYTSPANRRRLARKERLAFSGAADMWAVGAMLFFFATGRVFSDEPACAEIEASLGTEDATADYARRRLLAGAPELEADGAQLGLLAQLLVADDGARLTAAQAAAHAFFAA